MNRSNVVFSQASSTGLEIQLSQSEGQPLEGISALSHMMLALWPEINASSVEKRLESVDINAE